MLSFFDPYRNFDMISVIVKLAICFVCGGIIGLERSQKRRPAGLRTHILICIGAAITTLTGHYVYLCLGLPTDVQRIGSQVISGLGFIGAGSILVTNKRSVKGLTTAAGLWTSGIIGLAIGAGFFEGAIAAAVIVFLIEALLLGFEMRLINQSRNISVKITYAKNSTVDIILRIFNEFSATFTDFKLLGQHEYPDGTMVFTGVFTLRYNSKVDIDNMIDRLDSVPYISETRIL